MGARAPVNDTAPAPRLVFMWEKKLAARLWLFVAHVIPVVKHPLSEAPEDVHAELLAAWRRGEWHAEPRWNGVRVHVVRRGDDVATTWPSGSAAAGC